MEVDKDKESRIGMRKGSVNQPVPVQRSASFNATSTVPLKITIIDEASPGCRKESSYCVKNSKSLSNCSLISRIVSSSSGCNGDTKRNIISHLVPSTAPPLPIDGATGKRSDVHFIPKVPTTSCDVEKFRDYYV